MASVVYKEGSTVLILQMSKLRLKEGRSLPKVIHK